jgi:hypothetical protein
MRDYGRVFSTFWSSADIRALSDDGKLLALYLLSCAHGTIAGVCRLPPMYVCDDLNWHLERVLEGFAELSRNGFANRCETTHWVWVTKFFDWNRPHNPNQWKAARKIAGSVPMNCAWLAAFVHEFEAVATDFPRENPSPLRTVPKGSHSESVSASITGTASGPATVSGSGARATLQSVHRKAVANANGGH